MLDALALLIEALGRLGQVLYRNHPEHLIHAHALGHGSHVLHRDEFVILGLEHLVDAFDCGVIGPPELDRADNGLQPNGDIVQLLGLLPILLVQWRRDQRGDLFHEVQRPRNGIKPAQP